MTAEGRPYSGMQCAGFTRCWRSFQSVSWEPSPGLCSEGVCLDCFPSPTLPVGPAELRSRPSHRCLGPFSKPDLCWGQASERLAGRTVLPSAALQVSCAESRHAQSLSASCSHTRPWGCLDTQAFVAGEWMFQGFGRALYLHLCCQLCRRTPSRKSESWLQLT